MKKTMMIAVAALATLAACNKNEAPSVDLAENTPMAVAFDAYLNRGVATRSGYAGLLNSDALQTKGFGVFAYYTDFNPYDQQAIPNFMYNQKVSTSAWTYSPVKYWPNEYGNTAVSEDKDKVTFFAYAPYVDVNPGTGKVTDNATTYGIVSMNRNSAAGDPIIKYIGSFDPTKSVDLCWGVVAKTQNDGTTPYTWPIVQTGAAQEPTLAAGLPWIDVQRPADAVSQALRFDFKHALSQLNVQIDADVDIDNETGDSATGDLASNTKIFVRSISFTGLAMKGALNLNNELDSKAKWLDFAGTSDLVASEPFVIYDGRKDGREGAVGAVASNEKSLGLNENIISNDGNGKLGVTGTLQNLFQSASAGEFVYVIPVDEKISITINYDVETVDEDLPTLLSDGIKHGSRINNVITKPITFGAAEKFENGKSYVIKLHLGMNSVKFDADVTGWVSGGEANPTLPSNVHGATE